MDLEKTLNSSARQQSYKLNGEYLTVKKGERLFKQKDAADCFYLVLNGCIELIFLTDSTLNFSRKVAKNEFFGFEELLGLGKRPNTAIALENTELLKLAITDMIKKKPEFTIVNPAPANPYKWSSQTIFNPDSIKGEELGDIKIVHIYFRRGNLGNAVIFKNYLSDLIDKGAVKLLIDLSACSSIDSSFLGSLIVTLKRIAAVNGKLGLVCSPDICSWLFVMTKMDKVFTIYETVDEAIVSMTDGTI